MACNLPFHLVIINSTALIKSSTETMNRATIKTIAIVSIHLKDVITHNCYKKS